MTEKLTYVFHFIAISLKLNSHGGLLATVGARQPLEVSAVTVSTLREKEPSLGEELAQDRTVNKSGIKAYALLKCLNYFF